MTDTILMSEGMQTLINRFGIVDAGRFVYLMNKEPFDYTKFHHRLFEGMTLDEMCEEASKASDEAERRERGET